MVKRLTVGLLLDSQEPTDGSAMEPKLGEILEALRDITQPERKYVKFPWKENLRVRDSYYPHFMGVSLRTREASHDRERMAGRIRKLEKNRTNLLFIKLLRSSLDQSQPVNTDRGQVFVSDFPSS